MSTGKKKDPRLACTRTKPQRGCQCPCATCKAARSAKPKK